MGYPMAVARTQTLVQLSDELLTELDLLRARTGGRSRSELIREALELYLARRSAEALDEAIVAGYSRVPPDEDFGGHATVRASLQTESWDDVRGHSE